MSARDGGRFLTYMNLDSDRHPQRLVKDRTKVRHLDLGPVDNRRFLPLRRDYLVAILLITLFAGSRF